MTPGDFKASLASLSREIAGIEARKQALIKKTQSECPHPKEDIREGRHTADPYMRSPFRVCIRCGYAEQGWGAGYWRLTNDYSGIAEMSRDDAYKFVIGGVVSQEDMSGPEHDRYGHHAAKAKKGGAA